ncbi:hypothetical protein DH2020_041976 [Rehmannia glutinosa]|uniref:Uncharacterized protein n=1 Tax=Rehmannia glutinosa TaxID=99300 RepID=A0ABR0UQ73_REHGL
MAENTRLKDLQEAQKRMGQILQTEALKREATWLKLQEQITGMGSEIHDQMMGLNGKYDHLTNTLAAIQLQLLNISKGLFHCAFISGLSEEVQSFLTMFEPTTLQQTIDLGRKQIHTLESITKKLKTPYKPSFNPQNKRLEYGVINPPKPTNNYTQKPPMKLLTASEMAARREKGLCYKCDEAFTFGHIFKHRVNYMMMTEEEELSYLQTTELEAPEENMEEIQMSVNAITGEDGITTMRLYGKNGEHKLHILFYSGSTLSFIQEDTTRKLGCKLEKTKPIFVKVANGQKMVSSMRVVGFKWNMQGHDFTYSPRVLKNEGCDMILDLEMENGKGEEIAVNGGVGYKENLSERIEFGVEIESAEDYGIEGQVSSIGASD